jgi:hypothetical protein
VRTFRCHLGVKVYGEDYRFRLVRKAHHDAPAAAVLLLLVLKTVGWTNF